MAITISDIMTQQVFTLTPSSTLQEAHQVTREKGIRHLPIIDPENNTLIGIVTQKAMITKVVSLLTQFGSSELAEQEAQTNIMELAIKDFDTVSADEKVSDIAPFFLQNKHGCLPVTDEQQTLIGIVTSSDFVKLTVKLLKEKQE